MANITVAPAVKEMLDNSGVFKVLFVLADSKSRLFNAPLVYDSPEMAWREMSRMLRLGRDVKDGQKTVYQMFPDDFEMMIIGVFDSRCGTISALPLPEPCFRLSDVLADIEGETA